MNRYEKTPNLYQRFKDKPNIGRYDTESLMCQTFERVRPGQWHVTEKIDGMNIRIILQRNVYSGSIQHEVRGRSDRAQIPGDLLKTIEEMLINRYAELDQLVGHEKDTGITLYGEGYGPGIQKGGNDYRSDKGFVLFDIARWERSGYFFKYEDDSRPGINQYYLQPDDVTDIAENCRLTTAPVLMEGAGLQKMTLRVRDGFPSRLAKGERQAEGIIAQAPGLWHWYDGRLRRLKFKLKTKDFPS
jgi:hypothetical protein